MMSRFLLFLSLIGLDFISAQYLITRPESLLNNGADYLVITHNNFTSKVNPLCRLRDSLGMRVKMAEVNLIYQNFLATRPRVDRIKAFLHQVYNAWSPRPNYVLLVGDANRADSTQDFVPSKLFPKFSYPYSYGGSYHASDNWFVELADSNYTPDMIIGRLPVNTAASAESVVNKIIRYETTMPSGQWLRTVCMDASNDRERYAVDYDTAFMTPARDSIIRIYERFTGNTSRTRTIQAFNQGVVFILAVSHGAEISWEGSMGYTLFHSNDIAQLTNANYPVCMGRG